MLRHHPQDSSKGNSSCISIQLVNVTVCNQKALAYLAELALRDDKPNIVAVTESHLKGTYLIKVRRQLRTIGWKSFVTPAYAAEGEDVLPVDLAENEDHRKKTQ